MRENDIINLSFDRTITTSTWCNSHIIPPPRLSRIIIACPLSSTTPLKPQKFRKAHQTQKTNNNNNSYNSSTHYISLHQIIFPSFIHSRGFDHPTVIYVRCTEWEDDHPKRNDETYPYGKGEPFGTEST